MSDKKKTEQRREALTDDQLDTIVGGGYAEGDCTSPPGYRWGRPVRLPDPITGDLTPFLPREDEITIFGLHRRGFN